VRDVRQLEPPLDHRRSRALQDLSRIAVLDCDDGLPGIERGIEHGVDFRGRQIAMLAAVESDVESVDRALGLPEVIGDDAGRVFAYRRLWARILGDACRELHDCAYARHLENVALILDCDHPSGEGWRRLDCGVEHSRDDDVDPVNGAAIRLCRRVETRHRLTDEVESVASLEGWCLAQRKLCCIACELAVGELVAAPVDDEAFLGAAFRDVDAPSFRSGTDQHIARGGARGAQPIVERRGRHRGAFLLGGRLLTKRDLVGRPAGDESNFDPRPIRVELVGEDFGQRGARALSDLRLRQPEGDLSARGDDPIGDFMLDAAPARRRAARNRRDRNE
jgi:hypothetical protein